MRWRDSASLGLLLAGCASPRAPAAAVMSPGLVEEPVTAVLTAALDADRKFESADSLWDSDAVVVANGASRDAPPRFAGIEPGGEAAITSSRLEVRQSVVWVYFEYRWISVRDARAREGRATVILTPKAGGAGWKIVHAHSSTAP